MTPDQSRLLDERPRPRVLRLHRALARLAAPVAFMQSGAHPDDETSGMLAALGIREGLDLSYACATRGEGGRNDVGTEAGAALGTLRTAEMERAAEVLDPRLHWLSQAPGNVRDFGFSETAEETLARWGHDRSLGRLVAILRAERPDILCTTFLDVPGQHGHHRAMTRLAREAFDAAADPGFDDPRPPWAAARLLLPAWSGAGTAYDDSEPPPPATLAIPAGTDPVSGWSFERIGQHSRALHRTQGMGRWDAAPRDWPLHLAAARVEGAGLLDGLPTPADVAGPMEAARAAWPDAEAVARHAARALALLREAAAPEEHAHRAARKEAQLARVLAIAAGAEPDGFVARPYLRPGDPLAPSPGVRIEVPDGWTPGDPPTAGGPPSDPYPDARLPDRPRPPRAVVPAAAHGVPFEAAAPLEVVVLPEHSAALSPAAAVLNRAAPRPVALTLRDVHPEDAAPALDPPPGWRAEGLTLHPPPDPADGLHEVRLTLGGAPAATVTRIAHPHVPPRALAEPAALPEVRVGYVSGGGDRVGGWMRTMGLAADDLPPPEALGETDHGAIVLGHFAVRSRGLAPRMAALRRWVEAGGTLLTLYHRPWDDWDPETVPPRRIEIGQPSLRWRVTDEAAAVEHLAPDHPVLDAPNPIGPADWEGWDKERGLYFARSWDPACTPLLRMADPGEAPLDGALLCADVGRGRHSHCALILHHQMERLVPGAFRLAANLLALRG